MLISVPQHHFARTTIAQLREEADAARHAYFQHSNPGGLTPAEDTAWELDHRALELLLQAAEMRLQAEAEIAKHLTFAEKGVYG